MRWLYCYLIKGTGKPVESDDNKGVCRSLILTFPSCICIRVKNQVIDDNLLPLFLWSPWMLTTFTPKARFNLFDPLIHRFSMPLFVANVSLLFCHDRWFLLSTWRAVFQALFCFIVVNMSYFFNGDAFLFILHHLRDPWEESRLPRMQRGQGSTNPKRSSRCSPRKLQRPDRRENQLQLTGSSGCPRDLCDRVATGTGDSNPVLILPMRKILPRCHAVPTMIEHHSRANRLLLHHLLCLRRWEE